MKSVIVNLTLLSLLVVVSDAWFLNLGKSTESTKAVTPSAQKARKVILVAKKVYVPMYASDDTVSSVTDRLLPISSAALTPSETGERQQQPQPQQQQMVAYPQVPLMYIPPPVASYDMFAPAASASAAVDSAVPQYAIYPAGYGAADQQYVQYGVAPPQVMMYGTGDVASAPYYPTETDGGATAKVSAVPSEMTP